jgi:hypothetical protein
MPKRPEQITPDGATKNITALARLIGMPRKTLEEWARLPDFPPQVEGKWRVADVVEFAAGKAPSNNPEYEFERARKMRADAHLAEIRLAQQRAELIPAADVERDWSAKLGQLISEIDKGFASLAPKLAGRDSVAILKSLREWFRKVREESARIE